MLKVAQLMLIILTFYFFLYGRCIQRLYPLLYSPAQQNVEKFLRNSIICPNLSFDYYIYEYSTL
ncbi:MAG: hypothetical protein F6K39_15135 [Okeania sp. SIO3B3]|nr:hypothetical protein [Okeania sp. SIO3B3]